MSHSNSTPNYGLPQFVTTDKPFWLTDVNTAYSDIDTAIKAAKDTADTASLNASQAIADAAAASGTANTAKAEADGLIASTSDAFSAASTYTIGELVIYNNLLYECTTAVTTPGAWTGSSNWTRITIEDALNRKVNSSDLATVARTGSYNSLLDQPTIPDMAGVNAQFRVISSDTSAQSPAYTDMCIAIVGRGQPAMYVAANNGVVDICHNALIPATRVTQGDRQTLDIRNNSSATIVCLFLYK